MTRHPVSTSRKGLRLNFLSGIIGELKKVVWLSRQEAAYLTFLVLLVAATVGITLGAIDYVFTKLVDAFLLGK